MLKLLYCVFAVQVHPFQSGTDSAVFAVSFGIFIVPVTLFFVILLALGAVLSGGSLPELHLSTCFFPGTPQSRCSQSLFMIMYDSMHNFCQPACFLPLFFRGAIWHAVERWEYRVHLCSATTTRICSWISSHAGAYGNSHNCTFVDILVVADRVAAITSTPTVHRLLARVCVW